MCRWGARCARVQSQAMRGKILFWSDWRVLCAAAALALLAGCASAPGYEPAAMQDAEAMEAAPAPAPSMPRKRLSRTKSEAAPEEKPTPQAEPAARKVHYEGEVSLRAARPREVVAQAVAWARAEGGYVESHGDSRAVLQIPAARFRALYERVLGLGEVVRKSLSARDVTEEYLDVELRLSQARQMRDRLLALIRKSNDANEKLRLLREVEKLSAEIETHELSMQRLRTLVDYSRLTLQVQGREGGDAQAAELRGFGWVQRLAQGELHADGRSDAAELAVPTGMVAVERHRQWAAASADGVSLAAIRRDNNPRGDAAFWREALRWRLQQRYAEVALQVAGDFAVLRLRSNDAPKDIYWVALAVRGDRLVLAQVHFPTAEHEQRYRERILATLSGGGR